MTRISILLVASCLMVAASPAFAEGPAVEGPGYAISEGVVIHPRAGLETGVISNVFYEDTDVVSAPVLRLLAAFALSNIPPSDTLALDEQSEAPERSSVEFRAGAEVRLEQYLSSNDAVDKQSNVGGEGNLGLTIFPEGSVTLQFDDRFQRTVHPRNFESAGSLSRDVNYLDLGLRFRPGGGALGFKVGYDNLIDVFENDGSSFANRMNHRIKGGIDWQFLPITRFSLNASYGFFGAIGDGTKVSSNPLRIMLSGSSLLTERTSLRLEAGFAKGFYASGQDFTNAVTAGEFGFRYTDLGRITLAYEYNFRDSVNANFYRDHGFKTKLNQQIGLFLLNAELDIRLRAYRGGLVMGAPTARDDFIVGGVQRCSICIGTGSRSLPMSWLSPTAPMIPGHQATIPATNASRLASASLRLFERYHHADLP